MTQDVMANSLVYWVQDLWRGGMLNRGSKIWALTSEGTSKHLPNYGVVSSAKAALESHVRQLAMEFARLDAGVHRASVYRALEALTDAGLVQHVHLGHGATAYHLADDTGEHLHLQCGVCGAVIDAPVAVLGSVRRRLLREHGFDLDAAHVALSGTCAACREG